MKLDVDDAFERFAKAYKMSEDLMQTIRYFQSEDLIQKIRDFQIDLIRKMNLFSEFNKESK